VEENSTLWRPSTKGKEKKRFLRRPNPSQKNREGSPGVTRVKECLRLEKENSRKKAFGKTLLGSGGGERYKGGIRKRPNGSPSQEHWVM